MPKPEKSPGGANGEALPVEASLASSVAAGIKNLKEPGYVLCFGLGAILLALFKDAPYLVYFAIFGLEAMYFVYIVFELHRRTREFPNSAVETLGKKPLGTESA